MPVSKRRISDADRWPSPDEDAQMKPKPRNPEKADSPQQLSTAKVVLLGEGGVGKSALGWCLSGGEYLLHPRNHPMQYWILNGPGTRAQPATHRDIILWDMASEPDFRTIHPLYLGDADLALIVFDPTIRPDPFQAVFYWLKQIQLARPQGCKTVLVSSRADVGAPSVTRIDIDEFCVSQGIDGGYVATSAAQDTGLAQLKRRILSTINWRSASQVPVSLAFHAVKDAVLKRRSAGRRDLSVLAPQQLLVTLKRSGQAKANIEGVLGAVRLLAKLGYIRLLGDLDAELRILVDTGLFDALAASFVRLARQHDKGLGALEEDRLLSDDYDFAVLRGLSPSNRRILIEAVTLAFLDNRLTVRCRREAVGATKLLVFPEEVRLKRPVAPDAVGFEDGVSYTVEGDTSQLFPILVVSLAYTNTFARFEHWRDRAQYEFSDGLVCGFRIEDERQSQMDFILYFGINVGPPVRTFFRGLFESFLGRQDVKVQVYEVVECTGGHQLNRATVRDHMRKRQPTFCTECGLRVALRDSPGGLHLVRRDLNVVNAEKRLLFEKVALKWSGYVTRENITAPDCFISYAWGVPRHEHWVENSLASDLSKAGISVILDRWENSLVGDSVPRFVERALKSARVVVVGTPLYKQKYENDEPMADGHVLALEGELIAKRMMGTQDRKKSVLPILLEGTEETSLPEVVHGRVHADFRKPEVYFEMVFKLILSLYRISPRDPVGEELTRMLH
jgi:GTPase SAR1 family protein